MVVRALPARTTAAQKVERQRSISPWTHLPHPMSQTGVAAMPAHEILPSVETLRNELYDVSGAKLRKLLVANRGVRVLGEETMANCRKSPFAFSARHMRWGCTLLLSIVRRT